MNAIYVNNDNINIIKYIKNIPISSLNFIKV